MWGSRVSFALVLAVRLASGAELPAADKLIDLFIEKSGGLEAYAKGKNVEMSGTVEITGRNISGKLLMVEEDGRSYTSMEMPGIGRIEQGYNGEVAWEMNAMQGARIIEGDEKTAVKRASSFSLLTSWREEYKDAKTTGEETVEGAAAWKVVMLPKEGRPETFYFDKETGLLIRMTSVASSPLGDIPADVSCPTTSPSTAS